MFQVSTDSVQSNKCSNRQSGTRFAREMLRVVNKNDKNDKNDNDNNENSHNDHDDHNNHNNHQPITNNNHSQQPTTNSRGQNARGLACTGIVDPQRSTSFVVLSISCPVVGSHAHSSSDAIHRSLPGPPPGRRQHAGVF